MDNYNPVPNANMNPNRIPSNPAAASWTKHDHKLFENALVDFQEGVEDRWQKISIACGKTLEDIRVHYQDLVHDVYEIDSGRVELPPYLDEEFGSEQSGSRTSHISVGPWTVEEHCSFLRGVERYGKGAWKRISEDLVTTRTPPQIAKHAWNYYRRQELQSAEKKNSSINDITTPLGTATVPPPKNFTNQEQ